MPIPTRCTACRTTFDAPDADEGRRVTCPKCRSQVNVPDLGGFAVVGDEPPAPPPKRTAKPVSARVAAPPSGGSKATKALPTPVDEVDEVDEFEEDDRPRRRPRKPAKRGGALKWVLAGVGGVAALVVLGCGLGAYFLGAFDPGPPAGYATARSRPGGYRVFLPAPTVPVQVLGDNQADLVSHSSHSFADGGTSAAVSSTKQMGGGSAALDPDSLQAVFASSHAGAGFGGPWFTKPEVKPTTLGGQAAIEVRIRYKPDWMKDKMPGFGADDENPFAEKPNPAKQRADDERRKREEREAQAKQKDAAFHTVILTTRNGRTYALKFERKGQAPDEATVETVRKSFKFL